MTNLVGTAPGRDVPGVLGTAQATEVAVAGQSAANGYGVFGTNVPGSLFPMMPGFGPVPALPTGAGVYGFYNGSGPGVHGSSTTGNGVEGEGHVGGSFTANSNPKNDGNAVQVVDNNNEDALVSTSGSAAHAAVSAWNHGGGFAFWGASDSPGGRGIYARGKTQAAQFDGAVEIIGDHHVTGTMTVDTDIQMKSSDCAEDFDVASSTQIEPGTVMALDEAGALRPSDQSYDKKVAGVISGAGEFKPGMILGRRESVEKRAPLALMGKVYCKVDARYGSIEVGDLLTTSSTPGHAMKASDPGRAFGAVIGKALQPLKLGQALVAILVSLQ